MRPNLDYEVSDGAGPHLRGFVGTEQRIFISDALPPLSPPIAVPPESEGLQQAQSQRNGRSQVTSNDNTKF